MFLSCSDQVFTANDSEDEDGCSEIPSHHRLPFSCLSWDPSCGSYHLSSSLAWKVTEHMLFMVALSRKTMKFCNLQLSKSKIALTLPQYATLALPRDTVLLVKSGLDLPSWLRTLLCFAFYFGLRLLLSCLVLLIRTHTVSLYVHAWVTDSYPNLYAYQ